MAKYSKKTISIFFLGISSGLPFLLILQTLTVWLTESNISNTTIGLMALTSIPYSLKFIWAPFIDKVQLPVVCSLLGQRRGWLLTAQCALIISIIALGSSNPGENIIFTAVFALLVGFCAASQDIVIEAYRIEALPDNKVSYGASASVLGYRVGMLIGGAGALYIAHFLSWQVAYCIMALFVLIGIVATLLSAEPLLEISRTISSKKIAAKTILRDFLAQRDWLLIIPFLFCYKFADTVLNTMSMPFLIDLGFSKLEIAHVAKGFGTTAMIIGGIVAATILNKFKLLNGMITCCCLQLVAALLFQLQAALGHNLPALWLTMGIENLVCGMGQVMLITYLSGLCSKPNTATHYAALSSLASLIRIVLSIIAGKMADLLSWQVFYQAVSFGTLPALLIVLLYGTHFSKSTTRGALV